MWSDAEQTPEGIYNEMRVPRLTLMVCGPLLAVSLVALTRTKDHRLSSIHAQTIFCAFCVDLNVDPSAVLTRVKSGKSSQMFAKEVDRGTSE